MNVTSALSICLDWQCPRGWRQLWWKAAGPGRGPAIASCQASAPVKGRGEVLSPFFPSKMEPAALLHLQDSFVSSLVSSYLWFQWGSRGCSQQGKGGPQTSPPALLTWGARRAVPHTFPHTFPSLPGSVLPFLKYISTEAPPASLLGSAAPGAGAAAKPAGTGCVLARGSPDLFSQRPALQPPQENLDTDTQHSVLINFALIIS